MATIEIHETVRVATFDVHGTSPLLMHSPLGMASGGETTLKAKAKTIPTPEVEAEAAAYRLPDGQLYLPAAAFRSAIGTAAKGRKLGKVYATQAVRAVFVADEHAPLFDPADDSPLHDYEIDARRAIVNKAGIIRHRPMLPKWRAAVTFEIDEDFISVEHVAELLSIAGRMCGVGDYRPEKEGPFGRFMVRGVMG